MRSQHDFEVATWSGQREVATRNGRRDLGGLATGGLVSRHRFEVGTWPVEIGVATPFLGRDLGSLVGQKGGRDMGLTSRPSLVV